MEIFYDLFRNNPEIKKYMIDNLDIIMSNIKLEKSLLYHKAFNPLKKNYLH